jgi:N-acetylglucosamine-6-phosphate deacetylase
VTHLTGRDPETYDVLEVSTSGGRITSVNRHESTGEFPWISAGLVDLQVNGYAGFDINSDDLSLDTLLGLRNALREVGVTTFVPTVVTGSRSRVRHAVATVSSARKANPALATAIPFVHLEGPYISAQDGPRGCHDAALVRPPDVAEFDDWQAAGDGVIGMVTFSPHWPNSADFVRALRKRKILVAIGHTHATPDQIHAAADVGASFSTHLGNGAHATLPRHPNYLWSQLADDRLTAGFIADGHHLPADTFTAMLRAKGLDRAYLVSDVVAAGGLPPGRYQLPVGGDVDVTEDGQLVVAGTPYLAGAAAPLSHGVATAMDLAGLPLADALCLAVRNPGRIAGTAGLQVGAPADVITFEDGMRDIVVSEW